MASGFGATSGELELSDYLRILRRRWAWVLVPSVAVIALAVALTAVQPPRFIASAQVSLGNSAAQDAIRSGAGSSGAAASRELSNEVDLAASDTVRDAVEAELGVVPDVIITAADLSDAIRFTATAPGALEAARHANVWADIYVDTKRREATASITAAVDSFEADLADLRAERQQLRRPIDQLEDDLAVATDDDARALIQARLVRLQGDLEPELNLIDVRVRVVTESITDLELNGRLAMTGTARVVQVAAPPQGPANAPLERNLALAVIVGLILGAAAALLVENLDRTIKSPEDVTALGIPVLGAIPDPGRDLAGSELGLATMHHTGTAVSEAYQKVRNAVEFALLGRTINSLLITSPNQSEGKTTSACNLAWAMSAVDHRVALMDVDFRRPRLHEVFGCDREPGLTDHVRSRVPLHHLAVRIGDHDTGRNLVLLPAGAIPPNPAELAASPRLADLIADVQDQADLVILDAPPVQPVSDALSIARQVDAVVVVARARATTRDQLIDTLDSLRQVGADVLGVCIVGVRPSDTGNGYYGYARDEVKRGSGRRRGERSLPSPDPGRRFPPPAVGVVDEVHRSGGDPWPTLDLRDGREPVRRRSRRRKRSLSR